MRDVTCPVNTHNEWDPLEEIIVGHLDDATIPSNHVSVTYNIPPTTAKMYRVFAGRRFPKFMVKRAQRELDRFIEILEGEGVTIRRPDPMDFHKKYSSPWWSSRGFTVACPRDGILVLGDLILETPMPWRSRYFEQLAYRTLFKQYWREGARWVSAPKPQLLDDLYDEDFRPPEYGEPLRYLINDWEPVFDAADFVRCGRDLFVTKSNVTNAAGIEWLARFLGDDYRVHEIESKCTTPMHIDSTFVPLAPGKVLVNPKYVDVDRLPPALKSWDKLVAPEPIPLEGITLSMTSPWIALNVLSLDEKRVIVEEKQAPLIAKLKEWGFEPIPCPFAHYAPFGGSFHCATLDIRRRGTLESYCD